VAASAARRSWSGIGPAGRARAAVVSVTARSAGGVPTRQRETMLG
jgi:hypothetical protein